MSLKNREKYIPLREVLELYEKYLKMSRKDKLEIYKKGLRNPQVTKHKDPFLECEVIINNGKKEIVPTIEYIKYISLRQMVLDEYNKKKLYSKFDFDKTLSDPLPKNWIPFRAAQRGGVSMTKI
jgi:hypothetical protein